MSAGAEFTPDEVLATLRRGTIAMARELLADPATRPVTRSHALQYLREHGAGLRLVVDNTRASFDESPSERP